MSNTLRRIYKQNLLCEHHYPSAPEHQSSLSENTPESPVRSPIHSPVNLYAELDGTQEARSVIGTPPSPTESPPAVATATATTTADAAAATAAAAPVSKSPKLSTPVNASSGGTTSSPKTPSQRKIRHRRLGSADNNYHFILPKQSDRRNVRMVNMETQTDALDNISETNVNVCELANAVSAMSIKSASETTASLREDDEVKAISERMNITTNHHHHHHQHRASPMNMDIATELATAEAAATARNGNNLPASNNDDDDDTCPDDTVDHPPANLSSDEQLIYDYMNSNEQLDIRESSDEDNVEVLNRRVSQFFTQNGLLQTDNGNGSIIDNRLLLNIMAARRSCISINDKDEVTVMSRGNSRGNSFRTSSTASMFGGSGGGAAGSHAHDSSRRNSISYKISDHNCNNDDGDDSWTDEEGEDSDHNYSLRRRRYVRKRFNL